ncbi:uncharacterized protein LOC128199680 [Bicyclus anynana]|uniref:Uncharacterized protein LOC128199680 n=1 Tax=Bicyclus anynana TaxID=110368 RepID=A0ABM3M3W1_BICAN|nr:uncharacterized protein LOC128199680 [Bicyclus anynana]
MSSSDGNTNLPPTPPPATVLVTNTELLVNETSTSSVAPICETGVQLTSSQGAPRRNQRVPPSYLPPDLPATAAEVKDLGSLVRVVNLLSSISTKAIQEGRSVTASNKRLVILAIDETRKAIAKYEQLVSDNTTTSLTPPGPSQSLNSTCPPPNPIGSLTATTCISPSDDLRKELNTCIKEVRKLRGDLASANATVLSPSYTTTLSYAQMAKRKNVQLQCRDNNTAMQPHSQPVPPSTKPALVISTKNPVGTRQEAVEAFRKSISFREAKYAPSKVTPLSKNKLRVEFDSPQDCDDALRRLRNSSSAQVTAEPVKKLKPMIILKGISEDLPVEDLVEVILEQNVELEKCTKDEMSLKFKRNNRNSKLYNAVFVVSPQLFRAAMPLGRIRVDHQRVHVEEFSPFLQCHKCLQFGHVNKHCRSEQTRCAHCADTTHIAADCPTKEDKHVPPKCFNCSTHNSKFPNKLNVVHLATSLVCPILRNIRDKVNDTIDYGSTQ